MSTPEEIGSARGAGGADGGDARDDRGTRGGRQARGARRADGSRALACCCRELCFFLLLALSISTVFAQSCAPDTTASHASVTVIYDHPNGIPQQTLITATRDGTIRAIDAA